MLFGQEHVERYVATDGEEGHDWQSTTVLILTTTGRRSGEQRSTPLIYGKHGDDHLVVASKGGAEEHPAWYLNLERALAEQLGDVDGWGIGCHGLHGIAVAEDEDLLIGAHERATVYG